MNTKPFYLSLTIVGALAHLFITLAAVFGVDLGDQAGAITKTIEQCALAGGSLLATFSTIVGRIRARKQISFGSAPATKLFCAFAIPACLVPSGCATVPATGQTQAATVVSDLLTDLADGTVVAQDVYTAANAANQSLNGHGISLGNATTYANAAATSANSSGLSPAVNALATALNQQAQQLQAQGATPAQINNASVATTSAVQNAVAAVSSLPAAPPAASTTN
ncbi:MAG TPA: hypothetical protein VL981_08240 [Candidatus Methylacidiphilales bacterium]|nr:hypothetical protein [Candidatus Methylacidiphilales bacterium]